VPETAPEARKVPRAPRLTWRQHFRRIERAINAHTERRLAQQIGRAISHAQQRRDSARAAQNRGPDASAQHTQTRLATPRNQKRGFLFAARQNGNCGAASQRQQADKNSSRASKLQ
jgi:hypothetical protein